MNVLMIITGILILVAGGEFLVRGAVNIALRFHISTLVVGMTVVSFGTSAPELLVSLEAMYEGHPGIAVGNVIGSNIANISLVLGLTAMVFPIHVSRNSYRVDWPMLMLSTLLVFMFMWINYDPALSGNFVSELNFFNGMFMVFSLGAFSYFLINKSRRKTKAANAIADVEPVTPSSPVIKDIVFVILGSIGLSYGAHLLVEGTVGLASVLGISDYIVSVTVVAFGTSLPELITSVVAAFKKHSDLSVGNLIGSNIFNLLGIFGITAMFKNIPITDEVISIDMWWVIAISFIIFPFMVTRRKISKIEGFILFGIYVAYIFSIVA